MAHVLSQKMGSTSFKTINNMEIVGSGGIEVGHQERSYVLGICWFTTNGSYTGFGSVPIPPWRITANTAGDTSKFTVTSSEIPGETLSLFVRIAWGGVGTSVTFTSKILLNGTAVDTQSVAGTSVNSFTTHRITLNLVPGQSNVVQLTLGSNSGAAFKADSAEVSIRLRY